NVEAKLGYPARVIKETFFPETNTSEESVAWQGAKGKKIEDADNMFGQKKDAKPAPKQRQASQSAPQRPQPAAAPKKKPEPAKAKAPPPKPKKKQEKGAFGKIIYSFLMSGTIATVLAAALGLTMQYTELLNMIQPENRVPLVTGTFVLSFFVSLLVFLNRDFNLLGFVFRSGGAKAKASSRAMQSPMMRKAPAKAQAQAAAAPLQEDEFQVEVERGQEEEEPAEPEDDLPPDLDADMGGTDMGGTDMGAQVSMEPEPAPEPPAQAPQQPQAAPQQAQPQQAARQEPKEQRSFAVPEPKPQAPKKEQAEPSPGEAEARKVFASFVTTAQGTVQSELGELNAFSRFGLSLVLAGAVSSLGQSKRLAREPQINILKQGLNSIGNTTDRTETFCAELPGYGKNPRYTGMIQSGSKAMTAYMGGNSTATKGMGAMLADWSKPEKRSAVPAIFTFLFTDIAGSTAMTQQLGNAGAQKVVRAHNTAVRNAIAKVGGREVKHTGDGIMAVFSNSPAAVNASIQMQRDIAAHNQANPSLPLVVRIGINAGEAVEEENDFFGAAVQMTARICSKATDGNIWVSQSVVDACKGQRLGFIPRGRYEMKGIQGAKPLYEVGWTEKHKNELADL
ncbi:MAG: adenylate/guanylate cyclase domain-containing protein, partial [Rhodospirillaceae bacterium]|nr:adenylate/guanylate cyclase domain-containing protein [Rhodospirillaceae bacterium]